MSRREDFFRVLSAEKPERTPFISLGFWNERAMHKLAPADSYDENTLSLLSDNPPRDRYSREPRTQESRERAIRMGTYLDVTTMGVGKGGLLAFGHGGPGEIQPRVIKRTDQYKILLYEGGHKRQVHFRPHAIRYYAFPVKDEGDLDRLELPDMRDPERFVDIEEDSRSFKEADFVPTGSIQGFFAGLHNSFMDFQDTLMNLLVKPDFMKALIEVLARMTLDAVEMYMDRGVEVIEICDDLGNRDGLLISPELVRGFFLPWYEELVRIVHEKGGYVHLHSHGNIGPIMPDLVSTGVDIINPFDWNENPNLPQMVADYGDSVVFCGGSVAELSLCDLEKVERIVERACGLGRIAERGYIFLGTAANEEMSHEQWNGWRKIFSDARDIIGRSG